jgi:hypothetical protein
LSNFSYQFVPGCMGACGALLWTSWRSLS